MLSAIACFVLSICAYSIGRRSGLADGRTEGQLSVLYARKREFSAAQAILNARMGITEHR